MSYLESLEMIIAPRLEKNICEYYKHVTYTHPISSDQFKEHFKSIDKAMHQTLKEYSAAWIKLFCSHRDIRFSFWVQQFYDAYITVLSELGVRFFQPTPEKDVSWLIDKLIQLLKKMFKRTGFYESINQLNEKYSKTMDRIREAYCKVSQFHPDAPDLVFNLGLYPIFDESTDIQRFQRYFIDFHKVLNSQPWYKAQVVFSFFHIVRDDQQQRYVIRVFLTFKRVLYSEQISYAELIDRLWKRVTQEIGTLLSPVVGQGDLGSTLLANESTVYQEFKSEMLNTLDVLDTLPLNLTGLDGLSNRICILCKGFKALRYEVN